MMLPIESPLHLLAALETAASALSAVYIVCLIVGGGLMLVSLLFGSDSHGAVGADVSTDAALGADVSGDVDLSGGAGLHTDASTDLGHDIGHEVGTSTVHAPARGVSLAGWFSIQFVVYFLAVFGLVGTTLTQLSRVTPATILLASAIAGLIVGQAAHQALRALKRSAVGSDTMREDFLNRLARVSIAIEPGRRGEVAVAVRGTERFMPAEAKRGDDRFNLGDRVVVVSLNNGIAEVVSQEEFEFVTNRKPGVES